MGYRAASIMLVVSAVVGTPVHGALPADQMEVARRLMAANAKAAKGECASALPEVEALLKSPGFDALPADGKQAGYGIAASCALTLGKLDLGYSHALAATKFEGPNPVVWRMRLGIEVQRQDAEAALATVEAMAPRHQDAINSIPIGWFSRLNGLLRDKPDLAGRRRLLAILSKPAYVPDAIGNNGDGLRQDYATMLVESGDKATAAQLIAQIKDPYTLLNMSVDSRLSAMMPADFDARAAFEAHLARLRDLAASHRASLNVVVEMSRILLLLGRPAEALATLEASRPDSAEGDAFNDIDETRNWWWNAMAYAYAMLGRYEDAIAAFRGGIAAKERGQVNVSQTINMSQLQLRFGRARDALTTLAQFDGDKVKTSSYGAMAMRNGRGCARFRVGDTAGAKADLDYALAHERDSGEVVTNLQLCMNDLDGAAASLIRRLHNPDERADALKQLSDYDPPLATLPPDPLDKNLAAVKARPDVAAAIAHAGGIRRFNLQALML